MLEGDEGTPAGVAGALAAMTLALGRRVLIVDGVERWRGQEVEKELSALFGEMPADTTLAMFAREEVRAKAPEALDEGREEGGWERCGAGDGEAPRAARVGGAAGARAGARARCGGRAGALEQVGERQQRLLRELEKIALYSGGGAVSAEEVTALAAQSAERPSLRTRGRARGG